ncbi:MAG: alpha-galactosidase, partial [Lentisphaeria bacterium]|nr:alpha-galactosidase [Lentisphaeria bacterium]
RQGEAAHRFVLGTYSLLERLLAAHPDLFIEGCSAGGGRFDAGMLYYTPQIWTSDDTDAVERLYIQYGTSFGYPPSAMSCHVSDVPNRHVGRVTPLKTRGDVAMMGAFGYELDLAELSETDVAEIRRQIEIAREDEKLMLEGDFLRLGSPLTDNLSGWQIVAKDKQAFTVTAVRIMSRPNPSHERLRLRGLDAGALYRDLESGECFSGAFLMNVGVYFPIVKADFASFRRRFQAERGENGC